MNLDKVPSGTLSICLTKHLQPPFHRLFRLFARGRGGLAKGHLRDELPAFGNIPAFGHGFIDERVIMLQGSAQALRFQRRPNGKLVHGVGVLRPYGELVRIEWERGNEPVRYVLILIKQHRAVARGKRVVDLALGLRIPLRRGDLF